MRNISGLCMCGCGQEAPLSPTCRRGYERGEPLRYIKGHSSRKVGPDYVEEDHGEPTPCWIWQKSIGSWGYGRIWNGSGHDMAHRVYYVRHVGLIPEGHDVHHRCGQPACVNPDHLWALTRREHMIVEGRWPYGNPNAKVAA